MNKLLKIGVLTLLTLSAVPALLVAAVFSTPATPYTPAEVSALVDKLNYNASVATPHFSLGSELRAQHQSLFQKVEQGHALSVSESSRYRLLYQSILHNNQARLRLFDWHLTLLNDHALNKPNNIGEQGIKGRHDHHDWSATKNFNSLQTSLNRIKSATGVTGPLVRISNASHAYKDLTDIILHMATAPQTASVGYEPMQARNEFEKNFDQMMQHFKKAQFAPVNSELYIFHVRRALESYDALVLTAQSNIHRELSPWEARAAGRWLSWKSLGPRVADMAPGPHARTDRTTSRGHDAE